MAPSPTPPPENNPVPAPPNEVPALSSAPDAAPSSSGDKADRGCLVLLGAAFVGVFLLPAVIMLGGAAIIIPGLFALLAAVVTTLLIPAGKMSPRARWTGRILVFLVLCALAGGTLLLVWRGVGGSTLLPE